MVHRCLSYHGNVSGPKTIFGYFFPEFWIFEGHHQQSPQEILAHGLYVPAILWHCPQLKDDSWGYFFQIFEFQTQFLVLNVLRF